MSRQVTKGGGAGAPLPPVQAPLTQRTEPRVSWEGPGEPILLTLYGTEGVRRALRLLLGALSCERFFPTFVQLIALPFKLFEFIL